jgi:hypothetical protein
MNFVLGFSEIEAVEKVVLLYPPCSMLIDQGKFIGNDPIGHSCFNRATLTDGLYFYCGDCAERIRIGDKSLTFPLVPTVPIWNNVKKDVTLHT